jgi:hypothetical protein
MITSASLETKLTLFFHPSSSLSIIDFVDGFRRLFNFTKVVVSSVLYNSICIASLCILVPISGFSFLALTLFAPFALGWQSGKF